MSFKCVVYHCSKHLLKFWYDKFNIRNNGKRIFNKA
jgi:hypothetical protein